MRSVRIRQRRKTFSSSFDIGKTNEKRKMIEKGGFINRDKTYEAGTAAYTDWKHWHHIQKNNDKGFFEPVDGNESVKLFL